ncbi:hypothetical protein [Streptomyces sp. GS7]|nr:hypothetical protein [Streptomyces sp. GS7]QHC23167.1 hypothetical protein GR130_18865 [Streptomyces sp. GS7]
MRAGQHPTLTTAALFMTAAERGMERLGPAPHHSSRQSQHDRQAQDTDA